MTEEVQPVVSHQAGLTTYIESANDIKVKHDSSGDRKIANVFPVETPSQILGRNYTIASYTWTNSWAGDIISFPEVLMSVGSIADVFKKFKYFRADVLVEIRMNATPFHQGSLLITTKPSWDSTDNDTDLYRLSGFPSIVVEASLQESATFTIPYLLPWEWIETTNRFTGVADSRIGLLYIRPLNPLICTGSCGTLTVPVTILASFRNIRLEGFVSHAAMEGSVNTEAQAKNAGGIDLKPVVSAVKPILKKAPVIGSIFEAVSDLFTDLDKPINNESAKPIYQSYTGDASLVSGLDYAQPMSMYPNANLAVARKFFGMETSHMRVSDLAKRPMLYDKVMYTASGNTNSWVVTPLAFGENQTWPDWLYIVSRGFRLYRGSIKYTFQFIVPQFYSARFRLQLNYDATFSDSGDLVSKIIDIKGPTKIDVMVPYLRPEAWSQLESEIQSSESFYVPTLDLTMMTPVVGCESAASPLVYVNVWRAAGEDIQFTQMIRPTMPSAFVCGSTIIKERKQFEKKVRFKKLEVDAHCSFIDHFKKPFDGLISGCRQAVEKAYCNPEGAKTIADLQKRQSSHNLLGSYFGDDAVSFPCIYNGSSQPDPQIYGNEPFHYWSNLFAFWRGSRSLRHYQPAHACALTNNVTYPLDDGISFGNSVAFVFAETDTKAMLPNESFNVPWYNNLPWAPIDTSQHKWHPIVLQYSTASLKRVPTDIHFQNTSSVNGPGWTIYAGDDYMTMHPLPLPAFSNAVPPPSPVKTDEITKREAKPSVPTSRKILH